MSEDSLLNQILCDKCGKPRAIKSVIRKEKLGFMERTASEALEKQHRKLAETETDEFQAEIHRQLAAAQAKMRKEGLIALKLRCPDHPVEGDHSFFYENLPTSAPLIKQQILQCLKCGNPVEIKRTKTSGSFKVLDIHCSEHGSGTRKISTTLYEPIMATHTETSTQPPPAAPVPSPPKKVTPTPKKPEHLPSEEVEIKFCWNCGTHTIDKTSQYCHKCGVSLRPP